MFIKLEEFLINTLGDTTLVHLLCAVVLAAICGLAAFVVKIAMSVILGTLAKKGHHASVREAAKSSKEHKLGGKTSIDDFGSGYSSLNVLKDYHFDVLKIDMKFLSGFKNNEKTRPILKNIVNLTKQLNMVSLSEGVESKEQFEFLCNIGCDRAQGFLFSKPVPLTILREQIAAGHLSIDKSFLGA